MRVLTVFGTRPEAIKLAPVVLRLREEGGRIACRTCVTGQHREMLQQVLDIFRIEPDRDLAIMRPDQTLAGLTARACERLDAAYAEERPDLVLVQGDTTTAFVAALTAYYRRIPVGHVEAGLRTRNKWAPFPEEINRRLIGSVADVHFAPTARAREALLAEGVDEGTVHVTGNTVIDALLWVSERVREAPPALAGELEPRLAGRRLVLVTAHRRESFGEGMRQICEAILEVVRRYPDVAVVYPVHLNPNVRGPVGELLGDHERIVLLEPQPYVPFVWLLGRATIVLTDSGGVQEEAPSLGKPVLVMRETTERPEGLDAGNARLVGNRRASILEGVLRLLDDPADIERMARPANPYGDGHAAERIARVVLGRG